MKKTNARVSFVIDRQTKQQLEALVLQSRRSGRKMTLSKLMASLARDHVEASQLFKATSAAP